MSGQVATDKINILMVDDQPAKLLSYEVILAELGENLFRAGSAREALEHLLRNDVAVLLVDVCMPELDGFELAAMIREHPRFEKTAIIFVSAVQITDLDRLRGYAAGAVDYVPVPVVPAVLRAKVKVFAELYRKTRQLEQLNGELERRVAERTAELAASALRLRKLNEELEHRIDERTREREHALAQLFEAQKLDTIGQLTGGVAHDFNNLLMAVLGSLELLKKRLPDDPRSLRLLNNAVQGAERGAALTQRLLAFARRQELKPESVDLAKLVGGMEGLLERALGPGIRMSTSIPGVLPLVCVDANQLELALLNILVNARDAMPTGGSLTITARQQSIRDGEGPKELVQGDYVCLSVCDTGVGMDDVTLAKASEPFFTTKGPGKGTGLGLSMVHGLAIQSGGAMDITSKIGAGTTVNILLPKSRVETPPPTVSSTSRSCQMATMTAQRTILVVDDDPLVRIGTAAMLEDLGHLVIEVASGEQALEVLNSDQQINFVLTDHVMPGMNGIELAQHIHAIFPQMPIVLASGYAELPHDQIADRVLPRLAKPYRQEELALVISREAAVSHAKILPLRV